MKIFSQIPQDGDSVLVTLIGYKGSVPQNLGAKAVVTARGLHAGTVGGGKVEARAIAEAMNLLANRQAPLCHTVEWNLTTDIGMTCGGVVQFLFEVIRTNSWRVVVFGAGHVAQELIPMLCRLQASVVCVDSRAEWLEKIPAVSNLQKRLVPQMADAVSDFNSDDYFVLVTQGHSTDLPVVEKILRERRPKYIGVIGSKTKALKLREHLKRADFNAETIADVRCPIGLDIGDNTPVEIAFSIVAQLLQERDLNRNKDGNL